MRQRVKEEKSRCDGLLSHGLVLVACHGLDLPWWQYGHTLLPLGAILPGNNGRGVKLHEDPFSVDLDRGEPLGFRSQAQRGDFDPFLELPHLRVFVARPAYLLAMKCAAMRLGEEFHDLDDVRYLLRYLNISTVPKAMDVVTNYFDESQLLPKTKLALEEILGRD